MIPVFTNYNTSNGILRNSVFSGELLIAVFACCILPSNFLSHGEVEFIVFSTLLKFVNNVVFVGAEKQMFGIYAITNVAFMQYFQTVRNLAKVNFIRKTMTHNQSAVKRNTPIPFMICRSLPQPTTVEVKNIVVKAVNNIVVNYQRLLSRLKSAFVFTSFTGRVESVEAMAVTMKIGDRFRLSTFSTGFDGSKVYGLFYHKTYYLHSFINHPYCTGME